MLQVVEWCTHHKDDPELCKDDDDGEKNETVSKDIEPWDKQFFGDDYNTLFEIILVRVIFLNF